MVFTGSFAGRQILAVVVLLAISIPSHAAGPAPTAPTPDATSRDYVLWYRNFDSPAILALVRLALEKTPEYGGFRVLRSAVMVQERALRELTLANSTAIDIANVATNSERERKLVAIPIPIDGGLLGLRVCVTLQDKLPLFEGIRTINDLRTRGLSIGQGLHWPDTPVLSASGIRVVTHARFETLFRMLRNNRFDCFARGVSEVLYDLEMENDPALVIEPNLLIAYPMPSYFFVRQQDHETAQRLQLGMERAIQDGSFQDFLQQYYQTAVERLDLASRTMLVLENPYLSEDSQSIGRTALKALRERIHR